MLPRHRVSRIAIDLIKRFEGYRQKAARLPDGRWTIGHGHTLTARQGAQVSEADAEALLLYDLINVAHAVNEWTYAPLNPNQFDALCSFAFNIGLENFRRSTTLRRINEGRMLEAALSMELWRRADFEGERIVIDALVRRRAYEKTLFLKPVDAWAPAPSPVLPPKIDYDVAPFMLTQTPAVLKTDLSGERAVAARETAVAFTPLEDTGPTASELAAAAVSARLGAILSDDEPHPLGRLETHDHPADEPAEAADAVAEHEHLAAPAEDPASQPFPEAEEVPRDIDHMPGDAPPETAPASEAETTAANAAAADLFLGSDAKPVREPVSLLVWVALAFVGLALFISALRFGFRTSGGAVAGLDPSVVGWGLGLVGIALAATSVYFLLTRLTPRETPPKA